MRQRIKLDLKKIRIAMAEADLLTDSALATKAGVSRQTLVHIHSCGTCYIDTAAKIAYALGVPLSQIAEVGDVSKFLALFSADTLVNELKRRQETGWSERHENT